MTAALRSLLALLIVCWYAAPSLAETSHLACKGQTFVLASGEADMIKRFSSRRLTLTSSDDRTAITYGDGEPMEADITESHFRATRSPQSGDWILILLDRETLDVTVSEFISLPGQRHRSVRFEGRCEPGKPVA